MRLFKRPKKIENSTLFTDHIASLQEIASYYQKALSTAKADELIINIYNIQGEIIHTCTRKLASLAINQHQTLLVILQKMQSGKKITFIEHESLLKVPFFQQQTEITHYAHIEKPLKIKNL